MQTRDCSFLIRFNAYKINLISVISILDILFFGQSHTKKKTNHGLLSVSSMNGLTFCQPWTLLENGSDRFDKRRDISGSNKNPNENKNKFHDY